MSFSHFCRNHYQVAVLASDGQYNLEKGDNVGDIGDFWKEGMTLGPGNGRVFPNTDAYQFGSIRVTGVTITDIKKKDTVMTFRVSGLSETPEPTLNPLVPIDTAAPTAEGSDGEGTPSSDMMAVGREENTTGIVIEPSPEENGAEEAARLTDSSISSAPPSTTGGGVMWSSIIISGIWWVFM